MFAPYAKAIAPLLLTVVLAVLDAVNIAPEMTIEQVVTLIISSALVYFVPNKTNEA